MGVADHLNIALQEYDDRIRTFVPDYGTMLEVTAGALGLVVAPAPRILDLGTGTGALALACLSVRPEAQLVGLDLDPGMLQSARERLAGRGGITLREADFLEDELPVADAIVACIALHHIRTAKAKRRFYARAFAALRNGGLLVSADCFPGDEPALSAAQREAWLSHLEKSYSPEEAEAYLRAWSEEDVYFPLGDELEWLKRTGFRTEVLWRKSGFAVVAGFRGE